MAKCKFHTIGGLGLLAALAGSLAFQPVFAGQISTLAGQVETQIAAGDGAAAVAGARQILDEVWTQLPLGFSTVALADGDPSGFGVFNERDSDTYKPGEPIVIYAEPYGFGYGKVAEGVWRIAFDVDLVVKSADGAMLANMPNIMKLALNTRRRNKEFHANLTYNLTGAGPGSYVLVTTFRDQNSDKSASFEMPIGIAE